MGKRETLMRLMGQVVKQHRSAMHALLKDEEVFPGQPPVLFRLSEQDGLSQKELAALLDIAPATMTVMLNRMERSGIVERRADSRDQRVWRVHLTAKGREKLERVRLALRQSEEMALEGVDEQGRELLRSALERMYANQQVFHASGGGQGGLGGGRDGV